MTSSPPTAVTNSGATAAPDGRPPHTRRPWGWIVLAAVLGAAAIGLGVYALQVNSDLDDAEATIAEQEQAAAGGTSDQALEAVAGAVGEVTSALGATQGDVAQIERQIAAASESLQAAEDKVSAAAGDLERTEAERDAAQAKVDVVQACAQSVVSAFRGAFDAESLRAGIDAAAAELRALQPQCGPAISE